MKISIIIPVLNEAGCVSEKLQKLQWLRGTHELIMVDGGSHDQTPELAKPLVDTIVFAKRGRALQMNAGAAHASGDTLLFLHLDTELSHTAPREILIALQDGRLWGRFDVSISGKHWVLPIVSTMMNIRSRLTGIATGDQAMFVSTRLFHEVGGFPAQPLMEDIQLSAHLKKRTPPYCSRSTVVTSGRRWDNQGAFQTIVLMWTLRGLYWLGISPNRLAKWYGYDVDRV